ncbi:MAG: CinA family nicotinamide mononucleotide deamidase-related protein [Desulfobulbus sp.]|jgi:nicotinamide-nucleotide amidase
MRGEIIAIGDELISGRIMNSTSRLAARRLFLLGYEVRIMQSIGDDTGLIGQTLVTALTRADFVLVTGGLGSTDDDLTTAAAASALGLSTAEHPQVLARLQARLAAEGRQAEFNMANIIRFATLPENAILLDDEYRMAGYLLFYQKKPIWFLPGVPSQMATLFENKVIPELLRLAPPPPVHQQIYRSCGLRELAINAMLKPLEEQAGIEIGYYPAGWEVDVSLTARHNSPQQAHTLYQKADAFIRTQLGDNLFGEGEQGLPLAVGHLLAQSGKRLVVAESCTGGLLAACITEIPGSSTWFEGGVVVYSNRLKENLLGIEPALLASQGAVSEACARAMAGQALDRLQGDVAIAVTGIAGPDGGSADKPVGTVYLALADKNGVSAQCAHLHGSRREIQIQTVQRALDMVRRSLLTTMHIEHD